MLALLQVPEPVKPTPAKPPNPSVQPGRVIEDQKPALVRSTCGDAVKRGTAERKRRPSATQGDDSVSPMRSKGRKKPKYEEDEDEENDADLDFLVDEDEDDEAPKKRNPAQRRASGTTPKKPAPEAASAGRGGTGAGRGSRGGGGGRGYGRAAFFMEPKAPPPHKGEKVRPRYEEHSVVLHALTLTA